MARLKLVLVFIMIFGAILPVYTEELQTFSKVGIVFVLLVMMMPYNAGYAKTVGELAGGMAGTLKSVMENAGLTLK